MDKFKSIQKNQKDLFSPQFSKIILWLPYVNLATWQHHVASLSHHSAPKDAADDRPRGAAATGIWSRGEENSGGIRVILPDCCRVKVWNILAWQCWICKKHNMNSAYKKRFVRNRFQLMGVQVFFFDSVMIHLHSIHVFDWPTRHQPVNGSTKVLHFTPRMDLILPCYMQWLLLQQRLNQVTWHRVHRGWKIF